MTMLKSFRRVTPTSLFCAVYWSFFPDLHFHHRARRFSSRQGALNRSCFPGSQRISHRAYNFQLCCQLQDSRFAFLPRQRPRSRGTPCFSQCHTHTHTPTLQPETPSPQPEIKPGKTTSAQNHFKPSQAAASRVQKE